MDLRLQKSVGLMSVVLDETARTAECLDVDRLALLSIVINHVAGVAQFSLGFGGVDSNGKFHLDPRRASDVQSIVIMREGQEEKFDGWFRDDKGNPRVEYPRSFFADLIEQMLLKGAYAQWGQKYPDLCVELDGAPVFKSEKGSIVPHKEEQEAPSK